MDPHSPSPAPDAFPADLPLAAVLAGGESRRYGSPKALAEVDGRRLVERVLDALRGAVPDPVLITGRPDLFAGLGVRSRADATPRGGALAGVHTALLWAREEGRAGALVAACDLPFLHPGLLRAIVARSRAGRPRAVAPEGPGRHGVQPLCAWYSADALPEVERRLEAGERALGPLLGALEAERIPVDEVRRFGDPEVLFLNVNTADERLRAERLSSGSGSLHVGT